jgi:molecular chaperone HtpG
LSKEKEPLLNAIKEHLGEKVSDVKLSNRLKSSAVCLVSGDYGISLQMEQVLAEMNQSMMKASRILELNPNHPVFATLQQIYDNNSTSEQFKNYVDLLYGQALLIEGLNVDDPVDFANKVAGLMVGVKG